MEFSVIRVEVLDDYRLRLTFEGDYEKIFNMKPYLDKGRFAELHNETLFKTAHISFDTVEWDNGWDIDPEFLFEFSESVKQPVSHS